MRSFTTKPRWRWRDARDFGIGIQFWPLHWTEWRIRRYSSGMGWALSIIAGPIGIEFSINAGNDPR